MIIGISYPVDLLLKSREMLDSTVVMQARCGRESSAYHTLSGKGRTGWTLYFPHPSDHAQPEDETKSISHIHLSSVQLPLPSMRNQRTQHPPPPTSMVPIPLIPAVWPLTSVLAFPLTANAAATQQHQERRLLPLPRPSKLLVRLTLHNLTSDTTRASTLVVLSTTTDLPYLHSQILARVHIQDVKLKCVHVKWGGGLSVSKTIDENNWSAIRSRILRKGGKRVEVQAYMTNTDGKTCEAGCPTDPAEEEEVEESREDSAPVTFGISIHREPPAKQATTSDPFADPVAGEDEYDPYDDRAFFEELEAMQPIPPLPPQPKSRIFEKMPWRERMRIRIEMRMRSFEEMLRI